MVSPKLTQVTHSKNASESKHNLKSKQEGHFYTSTVGILFFGTEADFEAIQFWYFLDVIKTLSAQRLNNKNEMHAVHV